MVEPLAAMSGFHGLLAPIGKTPPGVTAREIRGLAIAVVAARRGRMAELSERMSEGFGLSLVDAPKRSLGRGVGMLGVGPARWLTIAEPGGPAFIEDLTNQLAGTASVVDQSSGFAVIEVAGPDARRTFEKGLPIDLDPTVFPGDSVATTSLAQVGVTIWAQGDAYRVAVGRSFAANFARWLTESAAEFCLGVV